MNVLGFDCAGRGCSAAVLRGDTVLASRAEPMERGQAEKLMPLIVETLAAAGVAATALDLVAVTTGPGGFTGVRIGLAALHRLGRGAARRHGAGKPRSTAAEQPRPAQSKPSTF